MSQICAGNAPTSGTATAVEPTTSRLILHVAPPALARLNALAGAEHVKIAEIIRRAVAIYICIVEAKAADRNTKIEFVRGNKRSELVLPF